MGTNSKPTLHSVAAHANVSTASVSRVINGLPVSSRTQERIEFSIRTLGYQPNSSARALKSKSSNQVCLVLPDIANPVFQSIIRGVQNGLRNTNYRVMLSTSAMTTYEIVKQLQSLGQNYADGLILNALVYDEEIVDLLWNLEIPLVLLGTPPKNLVADSIRVDNEKGIGLAVDYLRSKGHVNTLLLNGPQHTLPARMRKMGFVKSMDSYGITAPEKHILSCKTFRANSAIEALGGFKSIKTYDSIICGNDLLAAGALRFLSEQGISVPKDIAIVGVDNTDLAELLNPSITSVDFKAEYRGELAISYLLERLKNPNLPMRKLLIEPELVIRNSA